MSRLKRVLAAALVSALMMVMMAAPALAIVHNRTPSNECGQAAQAGGTPAAPTILDKNPVQSPPLGADPAATAPTPEACQ